MTQESVETLIINKGGRPKNPDRHLPDGSYNSKPFDPLYFKKYYQLKVKGRPVECARCGGLVCDALHMTMHQKTRKCMLTNVSP